MRWIAKAAVQRGVGLLPRAEDANHLLQRYVSRSVPRRDDSFRQKVRIAGEHFREFAAHARAASSAAQGAVFLEFGAGWDLIVPLCYRELGIGRQILLDVRPNLRPELIGDTRARLPEHRDVLEASAGAPAHPLPSEPISSAEDLARVLGIEYLAPADARSTGLPAGSVDFISSTSTLEHVPEGDLLPILAESARLLRPGGVLSCVIDLQDHYAYTDRSLSPYSFLRFGDLAWRILNPPIHYQNRLRCSDYERLFARLPLRTVRLEPKRASQQALTEIGRMRLARRFRAYDLEDLGTRELRATLLKAG